MNLGKNLVSSLAEDSLVIVSDWLDISLLYNVVEVCRNFK